MDPSAWIQVVQSLGVSVACLLALSYAIWKGIKWAGVNCILPMKDAHVKFLNAVSSSMRELVADHKIQGEVLTRFADRMEHVAQRVETVVETLQDMKKGKIVLKAESVTIQPKVSNAKSTGPDS